MPNPQAWRRFLDHQANRPPLRFVHGVRHVVPRGVCCPPHAHETLEVVYHPIGRGRTRMGDESLEFEEGSVVIHPPGQEHDQEMDVEGEDLCVKIAVPRGAPAFPSQRLYVPHVDDPALIEEMRVLSEVGVVPSPAEQTLYNLRATAVLLSLVHLACRRWRRQSLTPAQGYVTQAEQYLRTHFATIDSLQEVAEAVGVSVSYLRHQFRVQRGCNLVQYLGELRVARAKTLLRHARLPLKQIATLCGFRDEYYFSRVFSNRVRATPGAYRRRITAR